MNKRVLLLSDCGSAHTRKWATALAGRGIETGIFSMGKGRGEAWWESCKGITVFTSSVDSRHFSGSVASKLSYLRVLPHLKKVIRTFRPDIVHAHYATSYGLLGRLSGFHPYIISVWGSDVMDFPQRSFLHRFLLKGNLESADAVCATSRVLVDCIRHITRREVHLTPFGIDTGLFTPADRQSGATESPIVAGTVKSLEKVYRIDLILRAFAGLRKDKNLNIRLLLVGGGQQEAELKQLAVSLGVEEDVRFTGKVSMDDVPDYHRQIDIFINVPEYESFGVSVLEAMACGKPVVVSAVGGLTELVEDGKNGILIPSGDQEALESAVLRLATDAELRRRLGEAGRELVAERYELSTCVSRMLQVYEGIPHSKSKRILPEL
jgi:L-malate glycosyltransferase